MTEGGGTRGDWTDNFTNLKVFDHDHGKLTIASLISKRDKNQNKELSEPLLSEDGVNVAVVRNIYKIRNKDLVKLLGFNHAGMKFVQRTSKATITVAADTESDSHCRSYIEFEGTEEEVTSAEGLVRDKVKVMYGDVNCPVILIPTNINIFETRISDDKVVPTLLTWEVSTGCWIKIRSRPPPGDSGIVGSRVLWVYGCWDDILKLKHLFDDAISSMLQQNEVISQMQPHEPTWGEVFGEEVAVFFNTLLHKTYQTMIGVVIAYISLIENPKVFEKNPVNGQIASVVSLCGYFFLLVAVLMRKGWLFAFLVCIVVSIQTYLLIVGATFYGWPQYSPLFGSFAAILTFTACGHKARFWKFSAICVYYWRLFKTEDGFRDGCLLWGFQLKVVC